MIGGIDKAAGSRSSGQPVHRIAVLSPLVGGYYFGEIIAGIDETARAHGAQVIAVQTSLPWTPEYGQPTPCAFLPFAWQHIDGVIIINDALSPEDMQVVAGRGKPCATVSVRLPGIDHGAILPDNYGGMRQAVRHLIDHGHRQIAFVGYQGHEDIRDRLAGYRAALAERGIDDDPSLCYAIDDNLEGGGRTAAAAMIAAGMPCTAVVTGSDLNAIGLLEAVGAAGFRVPEDLAVIGFDDIELAQQTIPALSSVRQRFDALGVAAAEWVLARIDGRPVPKGPVLLPTSLVCRHSCGCRQGEGGPHRAAEGAYTGPSWQEDLAADLARQLFAARQREFGSSSAPAWPGAHDIVDALETAVLGQARTEMAKTDRAWQEAYRHTKDAEALHAMLRLLESAGAARQHVHAPLESSPRRGLRLFLDESRLQVLHAMSSIRMSFARSQEALNLIRIALDGHHARGTADLSWLRLISVHRSCLALWTPENDTGQRRLAISASTGVDGILVGEPGTQVPLEEFPPLAFLEAGNEDLQLSTVMLFPLATAERDWGVLVVMGSETEALLGAHDTIRQGAALVTSALEYDALLKEAEQQRLLLQEREQRFRALAEQATDLVLVVDEAGAIQYASPSHHRLLGFAPGDLEGSSIRALVHPDDLLSFRAGLTACMLSDSAIDAGEMRVRNAKNCWRTVAMMANNRLQDPAVQGLIINSRDITERKRVEAVLRHQTLHDMLTGLPNRQLLLDRVEHAIAMAQREPRLLALLLMDLDRFREVNGTLGHYIGDRLLQEVGRRLGTAIRDSDTIARLGGDEFAILIAQPTGTEGAHLVAQRILDTLRAPFELENVRFDIQASIGIALYPDHGHDVETLLRHADVAMYGAKEAKCGYAMYEADHDRHSLRRLGLAGELRSAIENEQLVLFYQPKIDLASGDVCGAEALVRWQHPVRGLIMPDEFIPAAEQTGLIVPLGRWALEAGLRQMHSWRALGLNVPVAINLSVHNLQDSLMIETLHGLMQRYGVARDDLTIEITESVLISDPTRMRQILDQLAALGVRTSVDDFGTGYSSLAYLEQLAVHELKIDRSFVQPLAHPDNTGVIVRSVIGLGHNLGARVVAEGVEDKPSWDLLRELGCDSAQGYYFSRAIPATDFTVWARNWRARGHSQS